MTKRYWERVEIGDKVRQAIKAPISRLQIAQFAAATDDFSPLNLDEEYAKNAGYSSVYAPGLMSLGFIEDSLRSFASNMRILSLSGTFQRLLWPGDSLNTDGLVLRRYQKNDEYRIQFSLWCKNQNEEVVMKASSTCILFKNADHEQASNTSSPMLSNATRQTLIKNCQHLMGESKNTDQESRLLKELV